MGARWAPDHLSRKAFTNRVYWAARAETSGTALPLFMFRRSDRQIVGGLTLDNIRRGPSQAGTLGYWVGEHFARQGFMREAIAALVHHAFQVMDLSRIEAACLPENVASRGVLEKSGFKYEASRRVICRSTTVGAIMCSTPICAMIGVGARILARVRKRAAGVCRHQIF